MLSLPFSIGNYNISNFIYREKTEFVSKSSQGKLAIRAVFLNDKKLLKSLIDDMDTVYKV